MKLQLRVRATDGSRSDHHVELDPPRDGNPTGGQCILDGQQLEIDWAQVAPGVYSILWHGRSFEARLAPAGPGEEPGAWVVTVGTTRYVVEVHDPRRRRRSTDLDQSAGPQEIVAPMPGRVIKILVAEGQPVAAGQALLVMEAMKMQNEIRAPRAGSVQKVYTTEGASVETGAKLVRLG